MHPAANDNSLMMDIEMIREPELSPSQFAEAQRELGLSDRDLADNLGLSPKNGPLRIRRIKRGEIPCSGPMAVAVLALLSGFRPAWYRGGDERSEAS